MLAIAAFLYGYYPLRHERPYLFAASPAYYTGKDDQTRWRPHRHGRKSPSEAATDHPQQITTTSTESDYPRPCLTRLLDTVRRLLAIHYKPEPGDRGPSWLTAIGHAKDSLWSVDLFRCESILLKSHWVMVVMDQYTRRVIGFAVNAGNVDGPTLCRMLNEATSSQGWPHYLSSDNDSLFQFHRWKANLRVLEVEEIKSIPHVPMSHPFVERLIGSIRRELLDHTFFWTATDLKSKLHDYQCYYNQHRTHCGRDGATPMEATGSRVLDINQYRWKKHCRGLFELPIAA